MNKNIKNFVITAVLAIVLSFLLPWWSIMIAAFIASVFIPLRKASVFFIPFLAILLYWGVYSYVLSSANDFTMAYKVSKLFITTGNSYLLILLTGVIGGLAAGLSGILGKQIASFSSNK